jgi:hypothetical protein
MYAALQQMTSDSRLVRNVAKCVDEGVAQVQRCFLSETWLTCAQTLHLCPGATQYTGTAFRGD